MSNAVREWFEAMATRINAVLALLSPPYDAHADADAHRDRRDREQDISVFRGPFF